MTVRHLLVAGLAASTMLGSAAAAQTQPIVPVPTSTMVQMPMPPAGSPGATRYEGKWQGEWQQRSYRGDWNGTYVANPPVGDPQARSDWLGECRGRLTASGQIGDQAKFTEACEGWLAYFQAVGPNQAGSAYAIPVMLVPVFTPNKDCVNDARVERPAPLRKLRRAPILRDKRQRLFPD